jgi:hypothetical protein
MNRRRFFKVMLGLPFVGRLLRRRVKFADVCTHLAIYDSTVELIADRDIEAGQLIVLTGHGTVSPYQRGKTNDRS